MRRVTIVPHTHWDREWHEPFQAFRFRLVEVMDQLLDLLEADPSYRHFVLDGQMAMIDDYLEVRPEAEPRLRALVLSGRVSVGPWYVLLDEHLVSGETIVRNLQRGLARAASFGGGMPIGYLPDMFGHVAQMPQLLKFAGIEHAVVWRGVPSEIRSTGFWWEAPDGSRVRAEYLPVGYANGAGLPREPKALIKRIRDHQQELSAFLRGSLLLMNGSDHLPPQPELGAMVGEVNALGDDLELEISSLADYLATAPCDALPSWRGELRSGARSHLLMGVTSNRVDVKRAAGGAERCLERRAEPLAALVMGPADWPDRLLELAWLQMLRNSAHDSICACSVDEVVDAVLHRYGEAHQIADQVARRALTQLARSMAEPGPVVVNLAGHPRHGIVQVIIADPPEEGGEARGSERTDLGTHATVRAADVQVVSEHTALPTSLTLDAGATRTLLGMLQGTRIGPDAYVQAVSIEEDVEGIHVAVTVGVDEVPIALAEHKQDLYTRMGARPQAPVHLRLHQPAIRQVLAKVTEVPAFGWQRFDPAPLIHPVTVRRRSASDASGDDASGDDASGDDASGDDVVLSNGLVTVELDSRDGTFAVDGHAGLGRLVDGGDHGDSYNYSPPRHDLLVDRPETVRLVVEESGPVRARARAECRVHWPEHIDEVTSQRTGSHEVEISTTIEVLADDPVVRVTHELVNPVRDHRLRAHLPLPEPAAGSLAESAFGAVHRGLDAQGRPEELGLPTFPARRFVSAGGLTVCHDSVVEYELVDIKEGPSGPRAHELALTMLRATGMLSRVGMINRPTPAGPLLPVEGLQMLGKPITLRYGLTTAPVNPWAMAEDLLVPLESVHGTGGGPLPPSGSRLEVSGAEISAVRRRAGTLEVRVFNPGDDETAVSFGARSGWIVDLRGRPVQSFEGSVVLRAHGVITVCLPGE